MNVSEKTEKALLMRYSDKNGNITFNDFVACYVKLKTMLSMCFCFSSVFKVSNVVTMLLHNNL